MVGLGEEDFCSLTPEQIEQFSEKFRMPEQFISLNGKLTVLPLEPPEKEHVPRTPVYRQSATYAAEHGQGDAYRASMKENTACRDAIEQTIREHYQGSRLDAAGARQVVEAFGIDRVEFVLAATIRQKEWDGRFSPENKDWAKTVAAHENKDLWGHNRNVAFTVTKTHPGLLNLFTGQVRRIGAERSRPSVRSQLRQAPAEHRQQPGRRPEPER